MPARDRRTCSVGAHPAQVLRHARRKRLPLERGTFEQQTGAGANRLTQAEKCDLNGTSVVWVKPASRMSVVAATSRKTSVA